VHIFHIISCFFTLKSFSPQKPVFNNISSIYLHQKFASYSIQLVIFTLYNYFNILAPSYNNKKHQVFFSNWNIIIKTDYLHTLAALDQRRTSDYRCSYQPPPVSDMYQQQRATVTPVAAAAAARRAMLPVHAPFLRDRWKMSCRSSSPTKTNWLSGLMALWCFYYIVWHTYRMGQIIQSYTGKCMWKTSN